ncbi:hypothetical protein ACKAV7_009727 [Fusarium commune]
MPTNTPATRRQAGSPTTDSQRLKKRESDRKAQRISRERIKSRIAYLEDLVQKLSSGDDNDKTLSLMAQLSEVTEQRDSLVRFLDSTSLSFVKHLSEAKSGEQDCIPRTTSSTAAKRVRFCLQRIFRVAAGLAGHLRPTQQRTVHRMATPSMTRLQQRHHLAIALAQRQGGSQTDRS